MGMAEMIAMMAADQSDDTEEMTILPEAAVMRLREVADRYAESLNGPRFKVGDLVTPSAGSAIKGSGVPHIVVETRAATVDFSTGGDSSSSVFGRRLDMRVLGFGGGGSIFAHWVESYEF